MLDALVGQLGHVDQALDAILDASERTEVGELRDRALDQLPNLVGARNAAPRLRLGALDRQGDLALVGVDAEDVNVHFLANLEQFAWVADTAPAQLGEVNESVSAPNVDEGAEVADRGDATRADLALLELLDELLLHRVTPLLDGLSLRKDEAIAVPVDFNDLERKAGADQAGHIGLLGRLVSTADLADLGCGHETTHAVEVHQQATLVVIGDLGLDNIVGLVDLLQPAPALLLAGTIDTDDRVTFLVLGLYHEDQDALTDLERVLLLSRQARVLLGRDDALCLGPDIDQELIPVDVHNDALHDVPVFQGLVVMAGIAEELLHKRGTIKLLIEVNLVTGNLGVHSLLSLPVTVHLCCLLANVRTVHRPSLKNQQCQSTTLHRIQSRQK